LLDLKSLIDAKLQNLKLIYFW